MTGINRKMFWDMSMREWSAAKQNQPVTLYDPKNSKVVGKVPRTSSESNIRYYLNKMEHDSREYNKTIKLLNLTDRGQNEKEGLLRQKGL